MRIALVVERFESGAGGVENVAWQVAHGLASAGDEVHVIARRASGATALPVRRVAAPRAWQPIRVAAFSRGVARAAPRGAFDLVYSLSRTLHQDVYRAGAGSHLDFVARTYPGARGRLRRLTPRHALLVAFEQRVFRDPTQTILCPSERVRGEIERRYGLSRERTALVRNGVDLQRFHPRLRERARFPLRRELGSEGSNVWLLAGSGFPRKGLDTALGALARATPRDAVLWVAGADRTAPWRRRAAALGVSERVRFLGFRRDLPSLYAAADALLLPTRYDAFANACLEACACGTPVVTSAANGAAELLGPAGFVVDDAADVAGFAAALEALREPRRREPMGRAARRLAEAHGWDAHVVALRSLFARVAGSNAERLTQRS